jgi:hypothetical protein
MNGKKDLRLELAVRLFNTCLYTNWKTFFNLIQSNFIQISFIEIDGELLQDIRHRSLRQCSTNPGSL